MRKTIGVFGGAFKPFHAGHFAAVEKIAKENDEVILLVSNKDRAKKGEFPLLWSNMQQIWDKYLLKIMPNNVQVSFVGNPITATYEMLDAADKDPANHNSYVIYASIEDLTARFSPEKLGKYFPRLVAEGQVEGKETGTRGITSGTQMRQHLLNDDLISFVAGLPGPVQRWGKEIWAILQGK